MYERTDFSQAQVAAQRARWARARLPAWQRAEWWVDNFVGIVCSIAAVGLLLYFFAF